MQVYLDYNATSPVRPEVRAAVEPLLFSAPGAGSYANASSVHWAGQVARKHLEAARSRVAARTDRKPSEVLFTSGGTEADNLALFGTLLHPGAKARRMIMTAVEHPAVRAAAHRLQQLGVQVEEIPVDSIGRLDLDELARALATPADLVATMAVNNETGVISDLEAIQNLVRSTEALWMVDAVQAPGRIPVPADPDLVVVSGHKMGGLKGVGCLLRRSHHRLQPDLVGGPQERGLRAGTEDVPAVVSLDIAWEACESSRVFEAERLGALQHRLEDALQELPGVHIVGAGAPRVPGVTTAVFSGVESEVVLQGLDLEGVAVSSGSACSSGSLEPSHVLLAMGYRPELALSSVRFSLGWATQPQEIDRVLEVLPPVLHRARMAASGRTA